MPSNGPEEEGVPAALRHVERRELPADQRDLLAAFGRFLRSMTELTLPAGGRVNDGPAAFLLYAMWLREIQLGRAVQELCIDGFAQEAQMLARAMIGCALDVMLICEKDSDRRALLYVLFQKKVRRERSKALVRNGHLSKERAAELEARDLEIDQRSLAAHAAAGTRPAPRLGNVRTTWSGISARQAARRFNRMGWYDLFYSPFSDTAHVNVAAIDKEVAAMVSGDVYVGGRFEDPWLVVMAAAEAVSGAADTIGTFHQLDNATARATADQEIERALGEHARRRRQTGGSSS